MPKGKTLHVNASFSRFRSEGFGSYERVIVENLTGVLVFLRSKQTKIFKYLINTEPSIDDAMIDRICAAIKTEECQAWIMHPDMPAKLANDAQAFKQKIDPLINTSAKIKKYSPDNKENFEFSLV